MEDEKWVGMHPKIANVYMTALAEHMTSGRGWHAITDETLDQLADVLEFKVEANNLVGLTDREALAEHLELHYRKTLKPCIDEVRNLFRLANVDTATSVLNINFTVPAGIGGAAAASGFAVDPIFGGIAGFAVGLIPTIQKRREEARAVLGTPAAWLLRVEEGLKPESFVKWVHEGARKFVLGV